MDLNLLQIISDFPFIYNGEFYDSKNLKQNKTCLAKCSEKTCLKISDLSPHICSKGFNVIVKEFGNNTFVFNGLIFNSNKSIHKGRREARKEWQIQEEQFNNHIAKIEETVNYLENDINDVIISRLSMFHDFKSSLNIFYDCTQDIIHSLKGVSFEDKLKNSDKSYKDLYNALDLITSQLGMIDVVSNPDSINFGNKKPISIYKLFDKLSYLFEHHRITKKKNVNIVTKNKSYVEDSLCHDSIEFIPLILLDNALKYSSPNSTVEIHFFQKNNRVRIAVKNIGPLVKEENTDKIFNKFFRGEQGEKHTNSGMGVGLWIAQEILKSHNSELKYAKDSNANGEVGLNIFEFELDTIPKD